MYYPVKITLKSKAELNYFWWKTKSEKAEYCSKCHKIIKPETDYIEIFGKTKTGKTLITYPVHYDCSLYKATILNMNRNIIEQLKTFLTFTHEIHFKKKDFWEED